MSASNSYPRGPMTYDNDTAMEPEDLILDDSCCVDMQRTQSYASDGRLSSYGSPSGYDNNATTSLFDYGSFTMAPTTYGLVTPTSPSVYSPRSWGSPTADGIPSYNYPTPNGDVFFGSPSPDTAVMRAFSPDRSTSPQVIPNVEPADRTAVYRGHSRRTSGQPSPSPSGSRRWQCMHPGCTQKAFGRNADLARHVKQVHCDKDSREAFYCDYKRCHRARQDFAVPGGSHSYPRDNAGSGGSSKNDNNNNNGRRGRERRRRERDSGFGPFNRKDHYRDHLRQYHREDLPKRRKEDNGGEGGDRSSSRWLDDRVMNPSWWRCGKCLTKVWCRKNGYACPECEAVCEPERRAEREARFAMLLPDA